ncbi:hypothetical protein N7G274_000954 [Stereocaulon virgatum]|uniref:Chromo domain-containing protein n=1 Tax=Stereocaulon virgatum TaxID=373712 RepID=A0ABR4AQ88_9LECA
MSDLEFARLRTLPEPVFRMPPFWRDFQQRENTASPSRSRETGGSQGEPFAILTSAQAFFLMYFREPSSGGRERRRRRRKPWREQRFDQGGADDRGSAAVAARLSASPPPPAQPSPAPAPVVEEEVVEWEIRKIVGKRRVGKGYEYRVRWKGTWPARRELGNAERLLKEFEV